MIIGTKNAMSKLKTNNIQFLLFSYILTDKRVKLVI